MPRHITEYVLYRWRYYISYILASLLVAALLVTATLFVPGGLSSNEQASAVISSSLSPLSLDPESIVDLPYNLLQHLSFMALGVTTLSIKLPSVILGMLSFVGIILLLRHWSHVNIAVIAAVIVTTTSQFIFSSQDGTPGIMYIFIPTWLLLLALTVSRQRNKRGIWEFLLVAVVAISLYTPLSLYVVLALVSATLLHPHLRFIVARLSRKKLLAAGVIGVGLLLPLILALVVRPQIGLTLLGIPKDWPNIEEAIVALYETHFSFLLSSQSENSQPIYTLPSILLALLGIVRLFRARHTARSYIITSWLLLLTPIILINPDKTGVTFVPVMLLIAAGMDELLYRWYSLFPKNPYARVVGLFPIGLLVIGMALTGIERYFYTYRYNPSIASDFSTDLKLLTNEIRSQGNERTALLPSEGEVPFYQAVATYNKVIEVVAPTEPLPTNQSFIITRSEFNKRDMGKLEPARIITNGKSSQADRLYLYKTTEK